jgi:sterol 14-demethylase
MGWRVVVDEALCQGHEVCEAEAPGVFEVGKDHKVRILSETPGDAERTAVEQAVKYCPTHALKIVDD